jgi:hypothetical protein
VIFCFDSGQVTEVTAKTLPCRVVRTGGSQRKLLFVLTEGRNRQIRCRPPPLATPAKEGREKSLFAACSVSGAGPFVVRVSERNRPVQSVFF